jgi:hypothetical protein
VWLCYGLVSGSWFQAKQKQHEVVCLESLGSVCSHFTHALKTLANFSFSKEVNGHVSAIEVMWIYFFK